jgi:hypothetical protein
MNSRPKIHLESACRGRISCLAQRVRSKTHTAPVRRRRRFFSRRRQCVLRRSQLVLLVVQLSNISLISLLFSVLRVYNSKETRDLWIG